MTNAEAITLLNLQNRGYLIVHDSGDDFPEIVRAMADRENLNDPEEWSDIVFGDSSGNYTDSEDLPWQEIKVYRKEELI